MVDVEHRDLRPHSNGDACCIRTYGPGPENRHAGRCYPWHTTHQNAAPTMIFLQIGCAHLRRHAPGDFAHWHQQRQTAVGRLYCFIGNGGGTTGEQRFGQRAVGGKMEIGKEN